jgi:hypothetical protein
VIESNNADDWGGGLYVHGSTAKILIDGETHISNNSASYGAGAYNSYSKLTIFSPVVIDQNKSRGGGGGLRSYDAIINIYGMKMCEQEYCFGSGSKPVSFIDNIADSDDDEVGSGGGLEVYNSGKTDVYNALFKGNQAYFGGAISARFEAKLSVKASHFEQNHGEYDGAVGVIFGTEDEFYDPSYVTIQDSVITNNGDGDLDDYSLFYVSTRSTLNLINNTIANNNATDSVITSNNEQVAIAVSSNIIDESVPLHFGGSGSTLKLDCLLISDNTGLQPADDIEVNDAMMFADADAGDYHLTADSPAIDFCDQGDSGETDKDGNLRGFDDPNKGNELDFYDLGAYEYLGSDIIFKHGFELGS